MMRLLFFAMMLSVGSNIAAQELPLSVYKSNDPSRPLVFYISGDGGWNNFSTALLKELNGKGFPVVALNAKSYFWNKKKPQQAANDVANAINQYAKQWNRKSVILIGFSFGADVMPFIQTRLPKDLAETISHTVLMSPSATTDFEIHVLGMFGWGSSSGESVPAEINKINKPVTILFGSDENDFPEKELSAQNKNVIRLAGGHHYDGNTTDVVNTIIKNTQ